MSRVLQIGLVIIFVGLAIGISEGIGRHGFNPFVIPVIAIVFGSLAIIVRTVVKAENATDVPETNRRLEALEKRITDIQDIVISIDDRLKEMSIRPAKQPDPSSD